MSRKRFLKKLLGSGYSFQMLTDKNKLRSLLHDPDAHDFSEMTAAVLVAGYVRVDAVVTVRRDKRVTVCDIYVIDHPESKDWIYYDSIVFDTAITEKNMVYALDEFVRANGLSYTDCLFEKLKGEKAEPNEKVRK